MEGWLTRIATNTCLNMLRSSKRHPELTISDLSSDENNWIEDRLTSSDNDDGRTVETNLVAADLADRALSVLSVEDRMTLLMIDGEDASIKEVADATGWSESKVKVRAFRARKRIREAMEKLLHARPDTKEAKVGRDG